MKLCVDSSRQMTSNLQFNNIYPVCQGVEGTWPPECTLSRGRFWPIWPNLAIDSGHMQQAGVILSVALCRGVQGEKTLNTDF